MSRTPPPALQTARKARKGAGCPSSGSLLTDPGRLLFFQRYALGAGGSCVSVDFPALLSCWCWGGVLHFPLKVGPPAAFEVRLSQFAYIFNVISLVVCLKLIKMCF